MAASTEEERIWEKEFNERCNTSPAAKIVWTKIENAQLAKGAKYLLYYYHANSIPVPAKISGDQGSIGSLVTKLRQAIQRASGWEEVRQTLLRDHEKGTLAVLRAGAKAHGVELSLAELVELAEAAHPSDPPLDKNVLQRYFDQPNVTGAEQFYRTRFNILIEYIRRSEEAC
jgi:hypothetical protein